MKFLFRAAVILITIFAIRPSLSGQDRLWGTLNQGGEGAGLIYSFPTDASDFDVVKTFELEAHGPVGILQDGIDGYLYGVTRFGGTNNGGVIYKMKHDGSDFSILRTFNGELLNSSLVKVNDYLYGTTLSGGPVRYGTIFKIKQDGSDFSSVYEFTGSLSNNNGISPTDGLLLASNNHLYGTTNTGGEYGNGTIFMIDPNNNDEFTSLYAFPTWGGAYPNGFLREGIDGYLYGTTGSGYGSFTGGTVFRFNKGGTEFNIIKGFADVNQGQNLYGSVIISENGVLFGSFNYGGLNSKGGIFKINPDGTNYEIIHHFSGQEGQQPQGELTLSDGYLYGVTAFGGENNQGTIYKVMTDGSNFTKLYNVTSDRGMSSITITLLVGKIYYVAFSGGVNQLGKIGLINEFNDSSTTIKEFFPPFGGMPHGRLLRHSSGLIYGTTQLGGSNGRGTLFKIDPTSFEFEVVHHFKSEYYCCNGNLIENSDGDILGVVRSSSDDNSSHIFEFDVENKELTIEYSENDQLIERLCEVFTKEVLANVNNYNTGSSFLLTLDSAFNVKGRINQPSYLDGPWITGQDTTIVLYGTSLGSLGSSNGRILNYDFAKKKINTLYNFENSRSIDGSYPTGALVQMSNRKLVGITQFGGITNSGVIYSINPDGTEFAKLYDFTSEHNTPIDGLTRITDSLFYGVIYENGSNFMNNNKGGAVYRYSLKDGFSIVKNFEDINGYLALDGLLLTYEDSAEIKVYGDLNFGAVEVDQTSKRKFYIKNFGSGNLMVTDISLPAGFSIDSRSFVVMPGEVKEVNVLFEPLAELIYSGSAVIHSNTSIGFNRVPLSGSGFIVVGLNDESKHGFNIYPNPAYNKLVVLDDHPIGKIKLLNSFGKIVLSIDSINQQAYELEVGSQSSGFYLLLVENEFGVRTKKLIITNNSAYTAKE